MAIKQQDLTVFFSSTAPLHLLLNGPSYLAHCNNRPSPIEASSSIADNEMEEELSAMLRVWCERGPTLVSAVLEERKRLLDLAALHRDDLSTHLLEAQNEITVLRQHAQEQQHQRENERNESSRTLNQLHASLSSLTKDIQQARKVILATETKLEQVTKERDNALRLIDERERSAENMIAALQKSMHSEAKAKSTASDTIRTLQLANIQYSQLVANRRLRAEKESRRADAAERKALDVQERLDKIRTEKCATLENKSRTQSDPVTPRIGHVGTKRKTTSSSRSKVISPTAQQTTLSYKRPRRNLAKVSYVYPVHRDADVQTRDKLCVAPTSLTRL